jgi:hypothetical protein
VPQLLDQFVGRHYLVGPKDKQCEQGALPLRRDH